MCVRLGLLVLVAALASHDDGLPSYPWLLLLLLVTLAVGTWWVPSDMSVATALLIGAEVVTVAAAATLAGDTTSPFLPYLVAPLFAAGHRFGNTGGATAAAASAAVFALFWYTDEGVARAADGVILVQWVVLGLGGGLLAAWVSRVQARGTAETDDVAYERARELLAELALVARKLPGALDPSSAADAILEEAAELTPYDHGAVLIGYGGDHVVPVAIRGLSRVPWREPLSGAGPLAQAWDERRSVLDVRRSDGPNGRRRDSTLLVVPLSPGQGEPVGLVALESRTADAYAAESIAALEDLLSRRTTRLEIALLFAELRHTATFEERERLAREMHDGVAQDLAYFGFELDGLKRRLARTSPEHAEAVAELRRTLTGMIQDIRLSITDLRSTVSPDRGLGAVLSSYVRHVTTSRGITAHLSLKESGFRLPAEQEMLLFRVAQRFTAAACRSNGTANLSVSLTTDPPHGLLQLAHDGVAAAGNDGEGLGLEELRRDAEALGWELVSSRTATGQQLEVRRSGEMACPLVSSSPTTTRSSVKASGMR